MQLEYISTCYIILIFSSIHFSISPSPKKNQSDNLTKSNQTKNSTSSKISSSSISKKNSETSSSRGSIVSSSGSAKTANTTVTSTSKILSIGGSFNSSSGSIILDFNASDLDSDLEISNHIPGILKYSAKSSATKPFKTIKGNGKELVFTKKIDHILCNDPFDSHLTVTFDDQTSEEYKLEDSGFEKSGDEDVETQEDIIHHHSKYLELNVNDPSDDFSIEKVNDIKCYKPKNSGEIVNKISVDNAIRLIETDVKENFICTLEDSGKYSILVAYLNNEDTWLKYTLSKLPSSSILMDVTLVRKFDSLVIETLFKDHSTPEDDQVFNFYNLKVNESSTGSLKSRTVGNKEFILGVKDSNNKITSKEIVFSDHFIIQEGFKLQSINTSSDYGELTFSYSNGHILIHETYVKKGNKYVKDLNHVFKFDLNKTKLYLEKSNLQNQKVLFLNTIVPDSVEYGMKISHFGRFKVIHFDKSDSPTFVILPNLELFLDESNDHRLVLCENGNHLKIIMNTVLNNDSVRYLMSTDPVKGNPFSIRTMPVISD